MQFQFINIYVYEKTKTLIQISQFDSVKDINFSIFLKLGEFGFHATKYSSYK